jgi:hypothetical protein
MKAKVIMLQANNDNYGIIEDLYLNPGELVVPQPHGDKVKYHNIYLVDTEAEVKEGDWFIKDGIVCQCNETIQNELGCIPDNEIYCNTQTYFDKRNCIKITATTNSSLRSLFEGQEVLEEPYPLSEQSIKLLVDYYNDNGTMPDEIEVEEKFGGTAFVQTSKPATDKERLRGCYDDGSQILGYYEDLTAGIKLNSKGEVDITIPEEKMYSKEEVACKIRNFYLEEDNWDEEQVENWINKNL